MDQHASDGVLLAVYDEQHDDELDSGRRHVAHCADCQARLEVIATRANQVRVALAAISPSSVAKDDVRRRIAEAHERRGRPIWRRPSWLAAAAVVVLGGVAAAFPIRQWIQRHRPEARTQYSPQPVVSPGAPPINRSGATVSFAATGPDFTVRFDSLPAAGSLTASRTTADQLSARVASGAGTGGDALVVLPDELLVRNTSTARASYDLTLPGVVTRLRVIVAGRVVFDGAPPTVIQLDRSR